jgi:hypothetical protein
MAPERGGEARCINNLNELQRRVAYAAAESNSNMAVMPYL